MSKIYYKPNRKDGDDETAATTGVDSAARAVPEASADTKPAAQSRDGADTANSVAERPEARRRRPPRPTNTEIYDESATAEAVAEMHRLFARGHTPKAKWTKACKSCSLVEVCQPLLAKRMSASAYVRQMLEEDRP